MLTEQTDNPGQHGTDQDQDVARHNGDDDKPDVNPDTEERRSRDEASQCGAGDHRVGNVNKDSVQGVRRYSKIMPWVVTTLIALVAAWCGYAGTSASISVEGQVIGLDGTGPIDVRFILTNRGNTTADELSMEIDVFCDTYPPPRHQLVGMKFIDQKVKTTLAADEQCQYVEHDIDASLLKHGNAAIYAQGVVCYKDMLGIPHEVPVSMIQGGPYPLAADSMGVYSPVIGQSNP